MALGKAQIKKFKEAEAEAIDSYDFRGVADHLADAGDKEWARKVYKKASDKAEEFSEFHQIAQGFCNKLGDKQEAKKYFEKSEEI